MKTRISKHFCTLIFLASTAFDLAAENRNATMVFIKQQLEISVEIAASRAEREQGLMLRTSLGEKQGMLFVYPDQAPRDLWMKNTLLPLDVLFLADDGRIVSMLSNLQPCKNNPCPIYNSRTSAMYMLELNAHFIKNNRLKIGQRLLLP